MKLFVHLAFLLCVFAAAAKATAVKKCSGNKPFPLDVRVDGCELPPCDIIKGTNILFEIDFVSWKFITNMTTLVKATTLGITVPYELPAEVRDVCSNLMFGAICPLYPTEDVSYLFDFPIGNYPEIGVKVEIYLVDQDTEVTTCFVCDIKVRKGNSGGGGGQRTIYTIDFKE